MSFFVKRAGGKTKRTATLVERFEDPEHGLLEADVVSGAGASDLDAAIALDIVAQGIRAATQLNFVRAKGDAEREEEEAEAPEVIVLGDKNN